jgi:glyoxylase-like metal-dependent hydrolase (beta-lactamase superfamily II)
MPQNEVEQIMPNLYRAVIPLPRNPLKATNSFIIKGASRNLIIDTGMNREECKTAMLNALDQLGVDLAVTDFFVTHLHADHVGLVDELASQEAIIYFNRPDAEILNYKDLWQLAGSLAGRHGFPAELVSAAIDSHPGQRYSPVNPIEFTMVDDGDIINYGSFKLQCIHTPGHTGGHTCLYETQQKLFFSGDHILGDITPNISTWLDESNPLKDYFSSLDRVYAMDIKLVLPGHRRMIRDCRGRIDELKDHHKLRLEEVKEILSRKGRGSAFEVAAEMTWDLVADCWDDFPLMQKWFATGEALAHICYLESQGFLKREMAGESMLFYCAK